MIVKDPIKCGIIIDLYFLGVRYSCPEKCDALKSFGYTSVSSQQENTLSKSTVDYLATNAYYLDMIIY